MTKQINEEKLASARVANRQDKRTPLLIRDDGMLYPNVPLVAKNPRYRPYYGPKDANLQQRMAWLNGTQSTQRRQVILEEPEPFNLGTATADEIVSFALEEFGAVLDADTPLKKLREQCFNLANLPDSQPDEAPVEEAPPPARTRAPRAPRGGLGNAEG